MDGIGLVFTFRDGGEVLPKGLLSFGLSTGTKFRFGWVEGGFRVGVEADAVVAVVINTGGVAAFLEGFIGARF